MRVGGDLFFVRRDAVAVNVAVGPGFLHRGIVLRIDDVCGRPCSWHSSA